MIKAKKRLDIKPEGMSENNQEFCTHITRKWLIKKEVIDYSGRKGMTADGKRCDLH